MLVHEIIARLGSHWMIDGRSIARHSRTWKRTSSRLPLSLHMSHTILLPQALKASIIRLQMFQVQWPVALWNVLYCRDLLLCTTNYRAAKANPCTPKLHTGCYKWCAATGVFVILFLLTPKNSLRPKIGWLQFGQSIAVWAAYAKKNIKISIFSFAQVNYIFHKLSRNTKHVQFKLHMSMLWSFVQNGY
jgi:hypothetical protein